MRKIALITPAKNELDNLPKLIKCIESQNIAIDTWIIVENGSDDGSREYLKSLKSIKNVKNFKVVNFRLPNDTYALGQKYSTVIMTGLKQLTFTDFDYIGILDADCFPPESYYSDLTSYMECNSLGISSGQAYSIEGKYDEKSATWPRGNCRLWKSKCLIESGYHVGPSADAVSVCAAELKGWVCKAAPDIRYTCREVGANVNYSYYGESAHFRGIPLLYAILKFFNYIRVGHIKNSFSYLKGYLHAFVCQKPRLSNQDILDYNKKIIIRKLKGE